MKIVCLARPRNYREHLVLFLLGLAGLIDSVVIVGTLGFISCDIRPLILFSEWPERYIGIEDYHEFRQTDSSRAASEAGDPGFSPDRESR